MSGTSQNKDPQQLAQRRAELILKVRSGLMTATAAAADLGVSRKTYYEWEKRGLSAMMQALEDRPTGRPKNPVDPEKTALKKEVKDLRKQLAETDQTLRIREMLRDLPGLGGPCSEQEPPTSTSRVKKRKKKRPGRSRKRKP